MCQDDNSGSTTECTQPVGSCVSLSSSRRLVQVASVKEVYHARTAHPHDSNNSEDGSDYEDEAKPLARLFPVFATWDSTIAPVAHQTRFWGTMDVKLEPSKMDAFEAIRRVEVRNRKHSAFASVLDGHDYKVEEVDDAKIEKELEDEECEVGESVCGDDLSHDEDGDDDQDEAEDGGHDDEEDDIGCGDHFHHLALDAKRAEAEERRLRHIFTDDCDDDESEDEADKEDDDEHDEGNNRCNYTNDGFDTKCTDHVSDDEVVDWAGACKRPKKKGVRRLRRIVEDDDSDMST